MTPEQGLKVGAHAAQAVLAAAQGRKVDAAGHAIDALLEAVDGDATEARKLLDEAAVRRANAVGAAAEDARFGADP